MRVASKLASAVVGIALAGAGPIGAQTVAPDVEREVRRLAERRDVQAAFRAIDELHDRTIRDHIMLTQIPAPPFTEQARARRYAELLRAEGVDSVWIDAEGNVVARRPGRSNARTVLISGHLDTVFPEGTDVTVAVHGDTLRAPGVGDDTRGLVVVLTVLRAMQRANLRTEADVLFVGTVGEEGLGDLRGVKHLFRDGGPKIDAFISVDGSNPSRVVHRGLGSHRYRVKFKGPGGHSWGAFGLANPHHAMGAAIQRFVERADAFTRDGPKTSYNVGLLGGGTSVNSIPFESWAEIDMRSESPQRLIQIDSILQRALREGLEAQNAIRRDGEPLTLEVEMVGDRPSGEIPATHRFVQRAAAATTFFGLTPQFTVSSTDANVPIAMGIPAITIGGGGESDNAHALAEWWADIDSDKGIKRALLIVVAEAGLAR